MLDFVRVACAVPPVTVGDPLKNAWDHCAILEEADARNGDVPMDEDGVPEELD